MKDYIRQTFVGACHLSAQPGYEERPGQVQMATAVDHAIESRKHLMMEGPTGSGKSFALLVPAIQHATSGRKHCLYVTKNIALQEQIVKKDLPALSRLLPWPFRYALIKGRNNYLCCSKFDDRQREGVLLEDPADAAATEAVDAWARDTQTGDVSELEVVPPGRVWMRYSSTSDDCKGGDCRYRDTCYAELAKAEASVAQVVVTNYHMLCADLAVRSATDGHAGVLPDYDVVICDEAHAIADVARSFFGFKVHAGQIAWLARSLTDPVGETAKSAADRFFAQALAYRRSREYRTRFRGPPPLDASELLNALSGMVVAFKIAARSAPDKDKKAGLNKKAERCGVIESQIREALAVRDREAVYYLEDDGRRAYLCMSPIVVADVLERELFGETTVICASATLATAGTFEHIANELGCREYDQLIGTSPFDTERQAALIVPSDMPDPRDPKFTDAVAAHVKQAIDIADGRVLGLFTSYKNLNAAYARCGGNGHRVLRQGEAPRTALVDEFRRDVRSSLLGTDSFWEGVDVPGEALSVVVIDRLPFASPDDPVMDAITERDPDGWFMNYAVPASIIRFKQGFGRLIRTRSDRGVVVCLDVRLRTKAYGRLFLRSLPKVPVYDTMASMRKVLEVK